MKHKLSDRYSEACYKYLKAYGRVVHYTHKYDDTPKWNISGLLHDMEQCLTEIQRIYNGDKPLKWGCKTVEEVIQRTENSARKLQAVAQTYRDKFGDIY